MHGVSRLIPSSIRIRWIIPAQWVKCNASWIVTRFRRLTTGIWKKWIRSCYFIKSKIIPEYHPDFIPEWKLAAVITKWEPKQCWKRGKSCRLSDGNPIRNRSQWTIWTSNNFISELGRRINSKIFQKFQNRPFSGPPIKPYHQWFFGRLPFRKQIHFFYKNRLKWVIGWSQT